MRQLWFAHAVYTGGNIWLFYGKFTDGTFFLMDDEGDIQILDADPSDFDESLYDEWQNAHRIELIMNPWERKHYQRTILAMVTNANDGGFTETDEEAYSNYFRTVQEIKRHDHMAEVLSRIADDGFIGEEWHHALTIQIESLDHSSQLWYTLEAIVDKYEGEVM